MVEKKFLYEMELDKENALALQKKQLTDAFRDIMEDQIKDVETRERAACHKEIERLMAEFEATLIQQLDDLGNTILCFCVSCFLMCTRFFCKH